MSVTDPAELKRKLRVAGFEIYRTAENRVQLAERIRDNLIMDSGITALVAEPSGLAIQVTVRAQASHFPGASPDQLWSHATALAEQFLTDGYLKEGQSAELVPDPGDPAKSLDTSHEILLQRSVETLEALLEQLQLALTRRRFTTDD
jgi:hypothetical protein